MKGSPDSLNARTGCEQDRLCRGTGGPSHRQTGGLPHAQGHGLRLAALAISLAGNLVLGSALGLLWLQPRPAGNSVLPMAGGKRLSGLSLQPPAVTRDSAGIGQARLPWDRIASTDLARFRDNLRAVGCPEATIRDLLAAEIAGVTFRRDYASLKAHDSEFWEQVARGGDRPFQPWLESLAESDGEVELNRLLGPDSLPSDSPVNRIVASRRRTYGWLPEDVRDRLLDLEKARWQSIAALPARSNESEDPGSDARMQQIEAEFEAGKRAALGGYWDEYQLRRSPSASWAGNLPGFEATEAEWRAVTTALEALEPQPSPMMDVRMLMRYGLLPANFKLITSGTNTPAGEPPQSTAGPTESTASSAQTAADWTQRRETLIRETLGAVRHAEFKRAASPAYREVYRVTQRLGLPDTVAVQAWELRQATEAILRQLESQTTTDRAAVDAALQQVRDETTRTLGTLLGESGLVAYREHAGDWLNSRTRAREALPSGE